jgi:hypothetical protein
MVQEGELQDREQGTGQGIGYRVDARYRTVSRVQGTGKRARTGQRASYKRRVQERKQDTGQGVRYRSANRIQGGSKVKFREKVQNRN